MKLVFISTAVLAICATAAAAPKESKLVVNSKNAVIELLKDPESARFKNLRTYNESIVCGEVNAKNSYGGYVGFKRFFVIGGSIATLEGESESFDLLANGMCTAASAKPKKAPATPEYREEWIEDQAKK